MKNFYHKWAPRVLIIAVLLGLLIAGLAVYSSVRTSRENAVACAKANGVMSKVETPSGQKWACVKVIPT